MDVSPPARSPAGRASAPRPSGATARQPRQSNKHPFVRNMEAGVYFEDFFLCALLSIVAIRLALHLSGYPQLGGAGFHIAHLLWGGLLMLAAILLLLGFLTATPRRLAAILAGLGFGLFIDELGKVITADNNYLFQPTVALIYVIFVSIYLLLIAVAHWGRYGPQDCLVNALEIVKEAVVGDLDEAERAHALRYIRRSVADDPATAALAQLLRSCPPRDAADHLVLRLGRRVTRPYRRLLGWRWLVQVAVVILVLKVLVDLGVFTLLLLGSGPQLMVPYPMDRGYFAWGGVVSALAAALLVLLGVLLRAASRRHAYGLWRAGLLVDLFLVQFFAFYESQVVAVLGLLLSVALLRVVGFAALREQQHWRTRVAERDDTPPTANRPTLGRARRVARPATRCGPRRCQGPPVLVRAPQVHDKTGRDAYMFGQAVTGSCRKAPTSAVNCALSSSNGRWPLRS